MPCPLIYNGGMMEWEKGAGNGIALERKFYTNESRSAGRSMMRGQEAETRVSRGTKPQEQATKGTPALAAVSRSTRLSPIYNVEC